MCARWSRLWAHAAVEVDGWRAGRPSPTRADEANAQLAASRPPRSARSLAVPQQQRPWGTPVKLGHACALVEMASDTKSHRQVIVSFWQKEASASASSTEPPRPQLAAIQSELDRVARASTRPSPTPPPRCAGRHAHRGGSNLGSRSATSSRCATSPQRSSPASPPSSPNSPPPPTAPRSPRPRSETANRSSRASTTRSSRRLNASASTTSSST